MYQIHNNIILLPISEINILQNNQVNWIINCSESLNNYMIHPNYINLNIPYYNVESIQILHKAFEFICQRINLSENIVILCENGIAGGMLFSMFFLMKYYNLPFDTVFERISKSIQVNTIFYYYSLKALQNLIIPPAILTIPSIPTIPTIPTISNLFNKMDVSKR